jgi:peptidoglycan/LPS O-acetylase OafA/YrhL
MKRIPSLDGIRAISILFVLLAHSSDTTGFPSWAKSAVNDLGSIGVRIFFVISGYLITLLLLRERQHNNRLNLSAFYVRRAFRILPAMYCYLMVAAICAYGGFVHAVPHDFARALSFTVNFDRSVSRVLGHIWSLSVEEQFYLLWPCTVACISFKRVGPVAAFVAVISSVIRLVEFHWFPSHTPSLGYEFQTVADGLAMGCVLAAIHACGTWSWLQNRTGCTLCGTGAIAVAVTIAGVKLHVSPVLFPIALNIFITAFIGYMVSNADSPLGRVLNWTPLVWLGTLSYSVYLWQQYFLHVQHSHNPLLSFPGNVIASMVVAMMSFYFVERPAIYWGRRLAASKKEGARKISLAVPQCESA